MDNQQTPSSPNASSEGPRVSDGVGQTSEAAVARSNEKRREVHERQREMLLESRKAAAALFRGTTEAAPKAQAQATPAKAPVEAPVAAPKQPQIDIEAEVAKRLAPAQAQLTAKEQQLNAAKAASDAELALAKDNPYEFLKNRGLDLDKWQARLMNGGEASAEEKFQQEVSTKIEQVRQENRQLRQQIEQADFQTKRQTAITAFTPVAEEHFPLVAAKVGVAQALDEMVRISKTTGTPVNPQEYFAALENKLLSDDTAYLQSEKVRAKLGLSSAKTPKADPVAETPRTLSNRTTSSVGSAKPQVRNWSDAKAAGRAMIQQLKAAGKL